MSSISKNSVSLAGEFAVLSQPVLRGYDANMTLGHMLKATEGQAGIKMENKEQILERRREIEQELVDLLKKTGSDFGGLSPAEKQLEYQKMQF